MAGEVVFVAAAVLVRVVAVITSADGTAAWLDAGATLETAVIATILEQVAAAGAGDEPPRGLQMLQ